jgi:hypothetical protein
MLLTLGTCNSQGGTAAREYAVRYPGRSCPGSIVFRRLAQRLREIGTREGRLPINCTDTSQWRCQNCSCGTGSCREAHAVSHDHWDHPNRGSANNVMTNAIHTTGRGAHIFFQMVVLYGCRFVNCCNISPLRLSSLYITLCGQTKHVLRLMMYSTSTTVSSGHGIVLMPSGSAYQVSFSFSVWAVIVSNIFVGPICYLTGFSFLETVLLSLLEDVPLMLFQHDGAQVHYREDIWQYLGATYPWRWTGRRTSIAWPHRSRDRTPTDYFLWGSLHSLPGLLKISWKIFRHLWQRSTPTC